MKTSTANPIPATTETYASAYARLASIAEKLKAPGATANIDNIVEDLRNARLAYRVCKERLDLIRREVDLEIEAAGEVTSRP